MRNPLRDFFDGVQDFRRDSFANAEVFAFDPIDAQGAWKQSKNSAQVDCLGDSEAMARKLRASLRRGHTCCRNKGVTATSTFWDVFVLDMSRAGELESEYALW